jgi:putative ABC transport system permease protein
VTALRQLRRSPGFTLLAAAVLALGAGAGTAMFSVINAVLLRPLPYQDAARLVWVGEVLERNTADEVTLTPNFLEWRRQNHVFTGMAAFTLFNRTLIGAGEAMPLRTAKASAALLSVLGVTPLLGRPFAASEDIKGQDRVALLSHALWQQAFQGARDILGRTVKLDDGTYPVAGILPADFHFPSAQPVDLITPLGKNETLELTRGENTTTLLRNVVARLKPEVTLEQARAEMEVIESRLPVPDFLPGMKMRVRVIPLQDRLVGNLRLPLWVLSGAVGFLLLLCCANVANLLLSRTASRRRELMVRSALGASRADLVRQFVSESLLLTGLGCGAGLLLAVWLRDLLAGFLPPLMPISLDYRVFGFAVLLAAASAILFGAGPALAGARSLTRWLNVLASAQIALAIVLLAGGALMLQSFWKLRYGNLGFQPDHVLTGRVQIKQAAFVDALLAGLRGAPGVELAAMGPLPPGEGHATNGFAIEGRALPAQGSRAVARQYSVSHDYFRLLGVPILRGRPFEESEPSPVAVVSAAFARAHFPGEDPLGHRVRSERNDGYRTIVGVAADIQTAGLRSGAEPVLYFPYRQTGILSGGDPAGILIRGMLPPEILAGELRKRVAQIDSMLPVLDIQTMDHRLTESAARPRLAAILLSVFASLGLLLAAVGLYGVMSFLVRTRFREIGIRMAIGARPGDVQRMILARSVRLIFSGVAVGTLAAAILSRSIAALLYGISPHDPLTLLSAIVFLTLVCLAATLVPARQAARVDPAVTLRADA